MIHIFAPLSTKPPSTFVAVVSIEPGSEPWFGSVSPKQPIISAEASFGRKRWRCSSVPKAWIGYITSDDCTDANER